MYIIPPYQRGIEGRIGRNKINLASIHDWFNIKNEENERK
jgi:hypothetical protein